MTSQTGQKTITYTHCPISQERKTIWSVDKIWREKKHAENEARRLVPDLLVLIYFVRLWLRHTIKTNSITKEYYS